MIQNRKYYPWIVAGLLCVVALLNYLDRQMLATMQPFMKADIEALNTATNFGRLMAIFLLIYALTSPLSGIIADRVNRKWMIVASLFIWSAVTFMMGYARTFNQLYVLRAVMGVSEAFYMPAAMALITDYHQGSTRSRAMSIHMTGIYTGQALGGFGAGIAAVSSWQTTFHTFGFIGMAFSIVLLFFLFEKKGYEPDTAQKTTLKMEFSAVLKGLSILLGNVSFWVILFYFSAPSLPSWATRNWFPTLFSDTLHMEMSQAGPIATITISIASLVGVLFGGYLSDKWVQKNVRGRIFTSAAGLGLTVPALFLLGFGTDFVSVVGGALCFGLGYGMFDVNNMPILCQFVSPRYRATGYGLMNLAGISAGSFITGFLGKSMDAGHLGRDFALLGFVVIAAIVLQLAVQRPKTVNKTDD
jgi:MFS family permease